MRMLDLRNSCRQKPKQCVIHSLSHLPVYLTALYSHACVLQDLFTESSYAVHKGAVLISPEHLDEDG